MERIILAFSSEKAMTKLRVMLEGSGYEPAALCRSGAELLRAVSEYDEALIIMGFRLYDMTVNHIYENLNERCRVMSIVRAEHTEDIEYDEILALPMPVTRARLISSINILLGQIPEQKLDIIRSADETRIVERAKLFLMERYRMTEEQSHRFLQKRSMDTGAKLADTARAVLAIDD